MHMHDRGLFTSHFRLTLQANELTTIVTWRKQLLLERTTSLTSGICGDEFSPRLEANAHSVLGLLRIEGV